MSRDESEWEEFGVVEFVANGGVSGREGVEMEAEEEGAGEEFEERKGDNAEEFDGLGEGRADGYFDCAADEETGK